MAPLRRRPPSRSPAICTSGRSTPSRAVAQFEDQRFFMVQAAVAGDGRQFFRRMMPGAVAGGDWDRWGGPGCSCSSQHLLQRRRSASHVVVGDAFRWRRRSAGSRTDLSCGSRRDAGTPAMMPLAASASTTGAAGFGSLTVNSLKKAGVTTSTPGSCGQLVGQRRPPWHG